ncbi:fetuin-B [Clupea harengus]|uniref:Fetuin-B n=1 Tax=Clupea harengus TaxID=7950 RepID=A0A6P8G5Z5_CLUHA|nr:fetuin-B [Clupea harengus]
MMRLSVVFLMMHLCWPATGSKAEKGCYEPWLLERAEVALDEMNKNRKEGYILKLDRLYDFSMEPKGETGTDYNFFMDVVETECHVLSRKPFKSCEVYGVYGVRVYGRCVISMGPHEMVTRYNCALLKAKPSAIHTRCPDCPTDIDLDSNDMEKVKLTLQQFNSKSGWLKYFALLNVTKATMQWVVGPSYFFQYTIQETICTKCMTNVNVAHCKMDKSESARVGFCKASHWSRHNFEPFLIDVNCEIYEPDRWGDQPKPLLGSVEVLTSACTLAPRLPPKSKNCPGNSIIPREMWFGT